MGESFNPEDYWKNTQPSVIFDNDTDGNDNTQTCGYNLSTVWSTDAKVQAQYRTATDYRGVHGFLVALGFGAADAHIILLPRIASTRERDPATPLDGISAPLGAATAWGNWPIEFRRPSNIRLFGHAWEWSGFLNYTKALPEYQLDLTALNKFTYYFTNQNGGRVYGSGFNEEGFLVTPQGLQDLATGSEVAFENIAESNIDIDNIQFPTSYNELSANKLTIATELDLGSASVIATPASWGAGFGATLPPIPTASTEQQGIVQMATAADLEDFLREDLAVSPAALSLLIDEITARLTPVGAVIYVPSSTPPEGWIKANGAAISRVDFAGLWAYAQGSGNLAASQASKQLGQFGPGNGTTTFTLPDLRAEFIRGFDDGRSIDTARTLGSSQDDAFELHAHSVNDPGHSHSYQQNQDRNTDHSGTDTVTNNPYFISGQTGTVQTGITIVPSGGTETRPRNVALLAVIKF
jgi:microcystin-dependent protein